MTDLKECREAFEKINSIATKILYDEKLQLYVNKIGSDGLLINVAWRWFQYGFFSRPEQGWVKVEEMEKKHEQLYLVLLETGEKMIFKWWATLNKGCWTYPGCNETIGVYSPIGISKVSHCIEIPPAPEEE